MTPKLKDYPIKQGKCFFLGSDFKLGQVLTLRLHLAHFTERKCNYGQGNMPNDMKLTISYSLDWDSNL